MFQNTDDPGDPDDPPPPPPDPTDRTPPPIPPDLVAVSGQPLQITLHCSSVSDAAGPVGSAVSGVKDYGWYVASSATGTYSLLRRTTAPNTVHTGLAAGTTRYYRVTARDNAGNESAQSAYVVATTALPVGNQAPVWTTPELVPVAVTADAPTTVRLVATDAESDPITYAATSLPAGWTLTELQAAEGALLTIPAGAAPGDYTVVATASDDYVPVETGLNNLKITAGVAGAVPWTFGQPFVRGDIPAGYFVGTSLADYQVEVRNYWDDGSVKFAVISAISNSGFVNIRASEAAPPTGTPVAEPAADWLAANVSLTLTGAGAGTYTPGPARTNGAIAWNKATPHKLREKLGHVMSEFHYYVPTSDAHLAIFWYLRCYANGAVEVETVLENGWTNLAGATIKDYTPVVTIGGTDRYTQTIGFELWKQPDVRVSDTEFRFPASSLADYFVPGRTIRWLADPADTYTVVSKAFISSGTNVVVDKPLPAHWDQSLQIDGHCSHARWSRVDWVGADPQVVPQHAGKYFQATLFTPSYYDTDGAPTEATLNRLVPYNDPAPFALSSYPVTMGAAGSNAEPLERAAIFYVKTGDARAYRAIIARARASGRYGWHYRDENTGDLPRFTDWPNYAYPSAAPFKDLKIAGTSKRFASFTGIKPPLYAKTHGAQTAYMAYLIEGRQSFLDAVEFNAQSVQWQVNSAVCTYNGVRFPNAGVTAYAVRGAAWCVRMLMEGVACLPDGHPRRQQYIDQLDAFFGYYTDNFVGKNNLGAIQPSTGYNQGTPTTGGQQFMQMFFIIAASWAHQLVGHLLSDPARAETAAKWLCKRVVGVMGDSTGYCYRTSGYYAPTLALPVLDNVEDHTPAEFNAGCLPDYRAVFDTTALYDPAGNWVDVVCEDSTALVSVSGSGYNANVLTTDSGSWYAIAGAALSWAVDLGVDGAAEGRARLTGASNWKPQGTSTSSGFRNLPDWGIYPRD